MSTTKNKKTTGSKKGAAKKKTTSPRKSAAQKRAEEALKNEVKGILLICLGLLLLYFCYAGKSGSVGSAVGGVIKRLFGSFGQVAFACAVILHGIFTVSSRGRVGIYIYILAMSATVGASLSVRYFLVYSLKDPLLYGALWQTASRGGFICSLIAKLMLMAFTSIGSWIILIFTAIVMFIVIFKKSFVGFIKKGANQVETAAAKMAENARGRIERRRRENEELFFDMEDSQEEREEPSAPRGKTLLETARGEKIVFIEAPDKKKQSKKKSPVANPDFGAFDEQRPVSVNSIDKTIASGHFIEQSPPAPVTTPAPVSIPPIREEETKAPPAFAKEKLSLAETQEALREVSEKVAEEAADDYADKFYKFPPYNLLIADKPKKSSLEDESEKQAKSANLVKVLKDYGIEASIIGITVAPSVTRYELQLQPGVKVSKVAGLSDDISYSLAAKQVRVEAPIPGKKAVGIEVPNATPATVRLSEVIRDKAFTKSKSPLAACLGKTITGQTLVMDITKMPHILIAGATGSGKSVCINTIIISILYHASPEDVKLILIDPKMVELNVYNDIPHLLIPVVTNAKEASGALGWAVREMEGRYQKFYDNKVKDIDSYNEKMLAEEGEKIPHIALIIDEFADLMMVSAQQVENSICRLAQLARACGIHLVLATQRPSVNVITGTIKANIPSRISFAVASQIDSRTILDSGGAEKLLGRGDMLYKPMDENAPIRAQGAFVTSEEVERIVGFIKEQYTSDYDDKVHEEIIAAASADISKEKSQIESSEEEDDESLIRKAVEIGFVNKGKLSTSMIQRKLRLGYARAGRIMDELEERGYVSPANGSKPRDVLISPEGLE